MVIFYYKIFQITNTDIYGGCLGVDLSTREGYSVKKTVWYTVFSCKSVASAKPGRMRGNAEAAVDPL